LTQPFTDRPPASSFLRGVTFPPYGGDTVWADTDTAYEGQPETLRAVVDTARVVHTNAYDYARDTGSVRDSGSGQSSRGVEFTSTTFETEHPVVRVHPETGERSLLLGGFARHINGLSSSESADLIRGLLARITQPEKTVRWQWRSGDVAVWDNRATQH
jgi:alpha-ketoglutarate-dependent sulfate ester dioxygenase